MAKLAKLKPVPEPTLHERMVELFKDGVGKHIQDPRKKRFFVAFLIAATWAARAATCACRAWISETRGASAAVMAAVTCALVSKPLTAAAICWAT